MVQQGYWTPVSQSKWVGTSLVPVPKKDGGVRIKVGLGMYPGIYPLTTQGWGFCRKCFFYETIILYDYRYYTFQVASG